MQNILQFCQHVLGISAADVDCFREEAMNLWEFAKADE